MKTMKIIFLICANPYNKTAIKGRKINNLLIHMWKIFSKMDEEKNKTKIWIGVSESQRLHHNDTPRIQNMQITCEFERTFHLLSLIISFLLKGDLRFRSPVAKYKLIFMNFEMWKSVSQIYWIEKWVRGILKGVNGKWEFKVQGSKRRVVLVLENICQRESLENQKW